MFEQPRDSFRIMPVTRYLIFFCLFPGLSIIPILKNISHLVGWCVLSYIVVVDCSFYWCLWFISRVVFFSDKGRVILYTQCLSVSLLGKMKWIMKNGSIILTTYKSWVLIYYFRYSLRYLKSAGVILFPF